MKYNKALLECHVTHLKTSHVTRHTSHVTRHTSHPTPHTSHLTPHTSHLTPHTTPTPHLPLPVHRTNAVSAWRVLLLQAHVAAPALLACRHRPQVVPWATLTISKGRACRQRPQPTPNVSANRQLRCSANGTHSTATHASTATLGACTFCCQAVEKAAQGHAKHGVKTGRMAGMQLAVAEQGWHHGRHGAASQSSHGCARLRHVPWCGLRQQRSNPQRGQSWNQ